MVDLGGRGRNGAEERAGMIIGVISDTHGLLRPEAEARLDGVDHILHAGDIGAPDIVPRLERIAPVTAIRGNVDFAGWARCFPESITLALGTRLFHMLHDRNALDFDPAARGIEVVVSGHSHAPRIERTGDVLYLNPGSAGRRRFRLPVTLAIVTLQAAEVQAQIVDLGI